MIVGKGELTAWASQFPSSLLHRVFELIFSSWASFDIAEDHLEVPITKRFCEHLCNNKNREYHYFRIEPESIAIDKDFKETGRIDLKFIHCGSGDERVYFSLECKRLRATSGKGNFSTLSSEYVDEGMARYVTKQYAEALNKGGMLGYVMDGDVVQAVENVKKSIHSKKAILRMDEGSSFRKSKKQKKVYETLHALKDLQEPFIIYHLFLPVSAA